MADPQGFLKVGRRPAPKRPVSERVRDYRYTYLPMHGEDLRLQASRCMDCGVPFCASGCPLGNLIPDWNDLVYRDRWRAAIDRLHLTNNFPEFTGMLCPAPCEASCVLSINDDPVTIKEIELSIVDRAFEEGWVRAHPPTTRTGRRVAIVGSGPAGLAAAQQLNRAGHEAVVFEKDDRIGGLLRYGIPDFKIEKWVVDRRLALLEEEGVRFAPGCHVGHTPTVEELEREFDAILLTVGALQGKDLPVPGRELRGIHLAMDYLTQQNRRVAGDRPPHGEDEITARDKRVVILGGGDTSADCLGNAHREGARSVQVLTHGPRPPDVPDPLSWPDWPFVLRTYPAHEEGGERCWNVAIAGFSGSDGQVERLHAVEVSRTPDGQMQQLETGWSGLPGMEHELEADLVLLAIGFEGPVRDRLLSDLDVPFGPDGALLSDERFRLAREGRRSPRGLPAGPRSSAPARGRPEVFVAGDARRGASLIVWAIAEGRKAAREIDLHLMGRSLLPG